MNDTLGKIKSKLQLLRASCSREPFPPYGSYLHFTGNKLIACNDVVYTEIDLQTKFIGSINLYVLEGLIRGMTAKTKVSVKKGNLIFESPQFKGIVPIVRIPIPKIISKPSINTISLNEENIYLINLASKFVSLRGEKNSVCIYRNGLYSTDGFRGFIGEVKYDEEITDEIFIDKIAQSVLKPDMQLGTIGGNLFIGFDGGFSVFSSSMIKDFPHLRMKSMLTTLDHYKKLCNIEILQKACEKMSSFSFGEDKSIATIEYIADKKAKTIMGSVINGTSFVDFETEDAFLNQFNIHIDTTKLSDMPIDFDVYIEDVESPDRLLLKDGMNSAIILMKTRL